jgi:Rrf2 family protein
MVNQQFAFAVHIMTVLAFTRDEIVDSKTLAASVNTNAVVVRRLLLALRRAKLIRTYAGKHGGAKLSKKPGRVTLLDIYAAVEPRSIIPVNERKAFPRCPVSCNMKRIMNRVAETAEMAVRKQLRTITLKQLVSQVR